MMKVTEFSKYVGTMQGLAVGDALGFPVEFLSEEQIRNKYGSKGIDEFVDYRGFPRGTYSDDTQMSIAVAEGLLESKSNLTEDIMQSISKRFIRWYNDPDNNRAPGTTCLQGVRNLDRGLGWRKSGVLNSEGCGAAMRTAPIGLLYYKDLDKLKEVALNSATITHNSDVARASAVANAYLVARNLNEQENANVLSDLESFTYGMSFKFTDKLKEIKQVLNMPCQDALKILGSGWTGEEAVASALYCAIKNDFDFNRTVVMAANTDGDSDSIASIAGGITGSYSGREGISKHFLKYLEKRDYLFDLSRRLFDKTRHLK